MFFTSKELILKYQKEDYEINDIFHLKLEIEAYPFINDESVYLECELLHCPLNNNSSKNSVFSFFLKIAKNTIFSEKRVRKRLEFQGEIEQIAGGDPRIFPDNFR